MAPIEIEEGNTRPPLKKTTSKNLANEKKEKRIAASKKWCFTWNNFPETWEEDLAPMAPKSEGFVFGQEVGESGTPHIQGYVEFKNKMRPSEMGLSKKIHWEKAKGDREANVKYCSKDGKYISHGGRNFRPPPVIKIIQTLYKWQQEVVDLITQEPDDRSIHWFWDSKGGIGKSKLVKYLCIKHEALVCSGKTADMKYLVVSQESAPELVIMDVPRDSLRFISYTGIEEIKNGCFASSKYESKMFIMNSPHVLIFANEPPDMEKMSADRWVIHDLNEPEEVINPFEDVTGFE